MVNATDTTPLSAVLRRDGGDLGVVDEFDGTPIGRVHITPDDGDRFRYVAGPEIEPEYLTPSGVDPQGWAQEHSGRLAGLVRDRYGMELDTDEGRTLFGGWLVHAEGVLPRPDTTIADVFAAVQQDHPRLKRLFEDLHDGTLRAALVNHPDDHTPMP